MHMFFVDVVFFLCFYQLFDTVIFNSVYNKHICSS